MFFCKKLVRTEQWLNYNFCNSTSCNENIISTLSSRAYSIKIHRVVLTKEHARIKCFLKECWYQESMVSKVFKIFTYNHDLKITKKPDNNFKKNWLISQISKTNNSSKVQICLAWKKSVKNYGLYLDLIRQDLHCTWKTHCLHYFANLKIELLLNKKFHSMLN